MRVAIYKNLTPFQARALGRAKNQMSSTTAKTSFSTVMYAIRDALDSPYCRGSGTILQEDRKAWEVLTKANQSTMSTEVGDQYGLWEIFDSEDFQDVWKKVSCLQTAYF